MLKTFIRTIACLAVSAAALIVVTKLDASAARSRAASVPDTAEPKPAPAPVEPRTGVTPLPAARTDDARAVTVPDWKGKRLSVARREARKLGLNVKAVDEGGEDVPADMASGYRVRRQLNKAGTPLEPGADVEVRVREIVDTAMGY